MTNAHVSDAPVLPFTAWYGLPQGRATCSLTAFSPPSLDIPESRSLHPATDKVNRCPDLVFLVRHSSTGKTALFDLGLAPKWSETVSGEHASSYDETFAPRVEAGLDEVLANGGVKADEVDTVVLSHHHLGHTGNVSLFPRARIVVGPGAKDEIPSLDFLGPRVHELSWHHSPTRIATFEHSHDVWGDGSLLVVPLPGHTAGHVGALVRTQPPSEDSDGEYVLLAADAAHHPALLRDPRANEPRYSIGRWRHVDEPVSVLPRHSMHDDYVQAEQTLERVKALARREEVMIVVAHDFAAWGRWGGWHRGLEGVELGEWKKKGMKTQ